MVKPFNEFVVKIASRCNINCDYCYEYNLGDESWRVQPVRMALATLNNLATRIAEHCRTHRIEDVLVTFHGGEPLLVGANALDEYCAALCRTLEGICTLYLGVQTNAILLEPVIIEVIKRWNILVSVSIDGPRAANDRHRVGHEGESSFSAVMAGIEALKDGAPDQFTGILSVIDIRNDPIEMFDFLAGFGVELIDFLLPLHTWDRPPIRPDADPIAYGRWYWRLYQAWIADRHPQVQIRYLKNIVSQMAGGRSAVESMTLEPCQLVLIATDGGIEAVDSLKSTASGAQLTGLNILDTPFDHALSLPIISIRQTGAAQLCETCRSCRNMTACAGGYFPHRYSKTRGFDNPSVYCEDLFWLVDQIREHLSGLKKARCPS